MKVRIKTAHGYISFQPDGRIEYRPRPGLWEEIDLEGFEFQPVPGPDPVPPPVDVGSPTAGYVAIIKARLQAAGVPLGGPCGAFEITKRVAWDLRHSGAGLLSKPSGNQCDGYASDIIAYADGRIVDILGDGGSSNTPQWVPGEDVDAARWRPAVKP